MKDSVCQGTNLIATILTFVYLAVVDTIVFWIGDTAFLAYLTIPEALFEYIVQAGIVVRVEIIELFDSVGRCHGV